jgi:hypothetical protein
METTFNLKSDIKFCIENFDAETAASRIDSYIFDALEIKEKEIRLEYSLKRKVPDVVDPEYNRQRLYDYMSITANAALESFRLGN